MPLSESKGNMYSWVTHTHTHIGGECPHQCRYCYVGASRWGRPERYKGDLRLIEKEFNVDYGKGNTIFVEHMNDAFAYSVPIDFIERILTHCYMYPDNVYVFQSKNPARILSNKHLLPPQVMIGTTIETNREIPISKAPLPYQRMKAMSNMSSDIKTFVTIEPIMDFDPIVLISYLVSINPSFINIGADSKHCGLPEPTKEKVQELINRIGDIGLTIKIKNNLSRLLG